MADVQCEVIHEFDVPARAVWDALVDWKGHEDWIPLTDVVVDGDDPTAVGTTFTATTGIERSSSSSFNHLVTSMPDTSGS